MYFDYGDYFNAIRIINVEALKDWRLLTRIISSEIRAIKMKREVNCRHDTNFLNGFHHFRYPKIVFGSASLKSCKNFFFF